jgi:hypothetical protein
MRAFYRLISRLGVTGKLAAIYLLDLMVTASIIVSFVSNMADQIDFSQKELEGTAIFAPARELYDALIHDVRATPGTGTEKAMAVKFAATDAARQAHGGDMSLDDDWAGLASAAADYDKARPGVARETAFHEYQGQAADFPCERRRPLEPDPRPRPRFLLRDVGHRRAYAGDGEGDRGILGRGARRADDRGEDDRAVGAPGRDRPHTGRDPSRGRCRCRGQCRWQVPAEPLADAPPLRRFDHSAYRRCA